MLDETNIVLICCICYYYIFIKANLWKRIDQVLIVHKEKILLYIYVCVFWLFIFITNSGLLCSLSAEYEKI